MGIQVGVIMGSMDNRDELDMALVNSVNRSRNERRSSYADYPENENRAYREAYSGKKSGNKSDNRSGRHKRTTEAKMRDTDSYNKKSHGKKKKRKKKHRVLRTLLMFILLLTVGTFLAVKYVPGAKKFLLTHCGSAVVRLFVSEETYNNIFDNTFNDGGVSVNEGIDKDKFKGYYTIALFGIDARDDEMDSGVNSDSIILLSINQDTGKVVMSSVYRDTWLRIPTGDGEYTYRKINSAFNTGGAKAAVNAMNTNFDLNISGYATINFQGLATIIDMLGGIDLTITDDEKYYINHYLAENRKVTGMDSPDVTKSGVVHLDGLQTVAYCRIRYCTFYGTDGTVAANDMGRTARQRYVLSLMIDKAKSAGVSKVLDIAEHVLSGEDNIIKTSIPYDELMDMIPVFIEFELGETRGFPFTYDFPDSSLTNGQSALVADGLADNVRELHGFLYDIDNYIPTDTIIDIDAELKKLQ